MAKLAGSVTSLNPLKCCIDRLLFEVLDQLLKVDSDATADGQALVELHAQPFHPSLWFQVLSLRDMERKSLRRLHGPPENTDTIVRGAELKFQRGHGLFFVSNAKRVQQHLDGQFKFVGQRRNHAGHPVRPASVSFTSVWTHAPIDLLGGGCFVRHQRADHDVAVVVRPDLCNNVVGLVAEIALQEIVGLSTLSMQLGKHPDEVLDRWTCVGDLDRRRLPSAPPARASDHTVQNFDQLHVTTALKACLPRTLKPGHGAGG